MSKKIRVAIVGVGNCASSLVQGIGYYGERNDATGLITPTIGGYNVSDIEVVAAFDVNETKVGKDLKDAIFAEPNCTLVFHRPHGGPDSGVVVQRGPTLDGWGKYLKENLTESDEPAVDVAAAIRAANADVVISYLPVGSERAARFYAGQAIEAGAAFVNCMPVFISSDPEWAQRFRDAGLPIIGDDIKSQVGATIVHRVLARLMHERGVVLKRTSQLNVGGNTDFLNMLERERLNSKKISKTQAVTSVMGLELPERDVHVGPSDYVPWLGDRKWAHIRLEGEGFGGARTVIELKLEVEDSPNSAGVVMDALRWAAYAKDNGVSGPYEPACAVYMKSPPTQMEDFEAMAELDAINEFDLVKEG
jgi:myo-inositol-1-phosphate synthase